METSVVQRPTVVDLAYGHVVIADDRTADVTDLLDAVDAPTVVLDGARMHAHQAWQAMWRRLRLPENGDAGPAPMIVAHPTTWGPLRSSVLVRATADLPVPVTVVPRALLIARSHTDVSMHRCVVVETSHVPTVIRDPAREPVRRWDVVRLRRTSAGWDVDDSDVLEPDADDIVARTESIVDDSVEAVFVDGAEPSEVTEAVDVVAAHTVTGRVVPVDRRLLRRHGWPSMRTPKPDGDALALEGGSPADAGARRSGAWLRRLAWVTAALVIAAAIVVGGVVGYLHRDDGQSAQTRTVVLGRTSLEVPQDWRQSVAGRPAEQADHDEASRVVFADRDDGRRILVVQTSVRADSTLRSVANSLGNRIRQRGDDVVTEFSPSTVFMGRTVISYREAPASGSAIRWYVLVEGGLQVSVGCQPGNSGEAVDNICERAVSSVRIAPTG